jgi:hypothetical protein
MLRLVVAFALLLVPIGSVTAEPKSANPDPYSPDRAKVAFDDHRARQFMDDFARCIASRQPRKAAAVLALPYGSAEQQQAARTLATAEYECLGPYTGSLELGFNAPSLASGMAEFFLTHPGKIADTRSRAPNAFVYVEPAGIEEFGECVVGQNPAAVEALAKSPVASDAESSAADALTPELQQCVSEGQTLALDRTALRQLLAVSLYKHIAMPPPPPTAGTAGTQQ